MQDSFEVFRSGGDQRALGPQPGWVGV